MTFEYDEYNDRQEGMLWIYPNKREIQMENVVLIAEYKRLSDEEDIYNTEFWIGFRDVEILEKLFEEKIKISYPDIKDYLRQVVEKWMDNKKLRADMRKQLRVIEYNKVLDYETVQMCAYHLFKGDKAYEKYKVYVEVDHDKNTYTAYVGTGLGDLRVVMTGSIEANPDRYPISDISKILKDNIDKIRQHLDKTA